MNKNQVGKLFIGSLFIISSLYSVYDSSNFIQMIQDKGIPMATIMAIFILTFKIVSGLTLIFGNEEYVRTSSTLLIAFIIVATIMYHNAFEDISQINNMMKNIAIIGGLFMVQ